MATLVKLAAKPPTTILHNTKAANDKLRSSHRIEPNHEHLRATRFQRKIRVARMFG